MSEASLVTVVVLSGFATAALSRLVTREGGLFGIFIKVRNIFPQDSTPYDILNCPLCFGVYAVTLFTGLAMLFMGIPALWFILLAPSALGVAYATLGLMAMIQ